MGKKIAMVMLSTTDLPDGENEDVAAIMKEALQDGLLTVDETSSLNSWKINNEYLHKAAALEVYERMTRGQRTELGDIEIIGKPIV